VVVVVVGRGAVVGVGLGVVGLGVVGLGVVGRGGFGCAGPPRGSVESHESKWSVARVLAYREL
jgi:hypothetical protein